MHLINMLTFLFVLFRIRKRGSISQNDSLEKVQRKRTKVEREKSTPGSRAGSVKIKFKKPDSEEAQPQVENRMTGVAGPSGASSSGLGKPEISNPAVVPKAPTPAPPPAPLPRPMVEANEADFMLEDLEVSLPSNLDSGLSIQTSGIGSGGQGGGQELQLEHVLNLSPTGPDLPRFSERYDLSMDGQGNSLLLDDSWLQNT